MAREISYGVSCNEPKGTRVGTSVDTGVVISLSEFIANLEAKGYYGFEVYSMDGETQEAATEVFSL